MAPGIAPAPAAPALPQAQGNHNELPSAARAAAASDPPHPRPSQANAANATSVGVGAHDLAQRTWVPSDLVGCRYRVVQAVRHPEHAATPSSQARKQRIQEARETVFALLPTKPSMGDARHFRRLDIDPSAEGLVRWAHTLEAMANEVTLITGGLLEVHAGGRTFAVAVDVLVRQSDGTYMPVLVTNHRVGRPDGRKQVLSVATQRLGLGKPWAVGYKLKQHANDSFALALADRALEAIGRSGGTAGLIGQRRDRAVLLQAERFQRGLEQALERPVASAAKRIKECAHCRFWDLCEPELQARDDISLFLPGDRSKELRREGINTVEALIRANKGRVSALAKAWRHQVPVLRTVERTSHPRFDVEVDLDVEAYLDQGAYLWGTYLNGHYRPFVTWEPLGGTSEAENFAAMWAWLQGCIADAKARGLSVGVFCYSSHGENHWLRFSARRFQHTVPGAPTEQEVQDFIASDVWVDVFAHVKRQLVGPRGLGLKIVAPEAGCGWEEDLDGEASVDLYRVAVGQAEPAPGEVLEDGETVEHARERLLSYNADDCRATAAVRRWLDAGAPGAAFIDAPPWSP